MVKKLEMSEKCKRHLVLSELNSLVLLIRIKHHFNVLHDLIESDFRAELTVRLERKELEKKYCLYQSDDINE